MQFVRRSLRDVFAIAFLGFAFATSAAAQPAQPSHSPDEQAMVGTWYGEFLPEVSAPLQRFITVRKADGTFTLHARMYQNDKLIGEARNSGLWGISNGIYFTVTTEVKRSATNDVTAEPDSRSLRW